MHLVLPPAVAALLPRPLDVTCRELAALCAGRTPVEALVEAGDAVVNALWSADVPYDAMTAVLRTVNPSASEPSEQFAALCRKHEPNPEDQPVSRRDDYETDHDWDRWEARCEEAETEIDQQMRADLRVMFLAIARAVQGGLQQAA